MQNSEDKTTIIEIPIADASPAPEAGAATESAPPEPEASIWSQPLQGLGDFLARYEPTENTGQTNTTRKKPIRPEPASGAPPPQLAQPYPPPGYPKAGKMPAPLTPNHFASPETPPDSNFYVAPGTFQNTEDNNENKSLISVPGKEKTLETIPDTDDLLAELTQRIIRDFRRFYP